MFLGARAAADFCRSAFNNRSFAVNAPEITSMENRDMIAELLAEDGNQRRHRQSLGRMLLTTRGPVRIATAYVTDSDLLLGTKNRKVQLLTSLVHMDIVSGATSLHALRSLARAGIECRSFSAGRRLHAKVYIFGDECGLVTSANLTKNALDSNIEVGIRVTGSVVHALINWFDAFWSTAARIGLRELSRWEEETAALRQAYIALRRKAGAAPRRASETVPAIRSQSQFRALFKTAPSYFVCNTNRRHSPDGAHENLMQRTQYAAVWTDFKYPTHMQRVSKGDAIFMFAKGAGIIGVGRAKAGTEILPPDDPDRITSEFVEEEEWRVPVDDWLAWAEDDEDAYPWKMPNASFLDVSGNDYRKLREGISRHFLRGS
jgi:hypothetical protein